MVRRTYGAVKADLARIAGSTGMSTADSRIMAYLNDATEELMLEHDFPSVVDRLCFSIKDTHTITLPSEYERIMLMNINCTPMQVQSPWFEFVGFGIEFIQEDSSANQINFLQQLQGVLDRDDVATFGEVPNDGQIYYLRVNSSVDERTDGVRPVINIQGYDEYGRWIRTQSNGTWVDGIDIEINGDTLPYYTQTTQGISRVTGVSKSATRGYVYLYVTGPTGDPIHIGSYAPKETQAMYRRYHVRGLNCGKCYQILARCRRRFSPITADGDYLIISNLPAIKAMMQAVYYREANKIEDYANFKNVALGILRKEAKSYIGLQAQKPLFTMTEGLGVRRDGLYIV